MELTPRLKKIVGGIVILMVLLFGSVVYALWNQLNNQGYAPDQPIPFSHKRHAGENGIPCMYCHSNADNSKHATVPSLNVCMNCHRVVKTDSPHIKKLQELYSKGKSIDWIKVHDMPDFVLFNHKRHIAKGFACETCHGEVKEMAKIEQVKPLNMGFCIHCHRQNNAPTDCSTCHQ